jgi:hypothetical protein
MITVHSRRRRRITTTIPSTCYSYAIILYLYSLLPIDIYINLLVDACACDSIAPLFIAAGVAVKTPKVATTATTVRFILFIVIKT